jgi:uncharacterized protein (DUF608 family)
VVTANAVYVDNTYGWIYQMAKSFVITGNQSAVEEQRGAIIRATAHTASLIQSKRFSQIPGPASNTYDDFCELPIDAYVASMYPMVMQASAVLATALDDHTLAANCTARAEQAGKDFVDALYNGKFYAYGCQLNGTGRQDDVIFSGMLAGQMLSQHAGWGDLPNVPLASIVSSVEQQLALQVGRSCRARLRQKCTLEDATFLSGVHFSYRLALYIPSKH